MLTKSKNKPPKTTRPHMPGYGLPKTKKGLLPWKWAEERLKKSRQYWIATTRPDGRPHVMVIWGTEDAAEAVVLEGMIKTERDVKTIREFLRVYEKKYKFDMSGMADDLLKLKEPVFYLRPRVGFGLWEKKFSTSATRWLF